MIYSFGTNQDGKPITVDTESEEFKRRVAWLADQAGLQAPTLREYLNRSPNVAGGNIASGESLTPDANVVFGKDGAEAAVSIRLIDDGGDVNTIKNLQGALAWLNIQLGLGITEQAIEHMLYAAPQPPVPAEDWQAKDSPMAEPLPAQPGRFKSRSTGRKIGDKWTGPSGSTYELTNIGGIFQYLAWVQQQ